MSPPPDASAQDRAAQPSAEDPPGEAELTAYVRRNVWGALAVLVLLVGGLGVVGAVWEEELFATAGFIYAHVGLTGLLLVIFLADSIIMPFPPDVVLIIMAKTWVHNHWYIAIPLVGVMSAVAGNTAWLLSTRVGHTRAFTRWFGRFRRMNEALVRRYGPWAVALAALTPIPFSVTCWTVGILHMPWKNFGWVTLLRVPRYVAYYAAIAYADELARMLV
jgi:membrane protein YqaA with SNARE-associated domain